MMANFLSLDWATGFPNIWLNIVLGVFPEKNDL